MIFVLKEGAEPDGVHSEVWFALGAMAAIYWELFGKALVVTSLRDGVHGGNSLHAKGYAADARTRDLSQSDKERFHAACREALYLHGFDLVSEGPPWNDRAPHEHCEFDPKEGRTFLGWED